MNLRAIWEVGGASFAGRRTRSSRESIPAVTITAPTPAHRKRAQRLAKKDAKAHGLEFDGSGSTLTRAASGHRAARRDFLDPRAHGARYGLTYRFVAGGAQVGRRGGGEVVGMVSRESVAGLPKGQTISTIVVGQRSLSPTLQVRS